VPTPTVVSERDIIVRMEAAPINPSDLHAVGMTARLGQVSTRWYRTPLAGWTVSTESPPPGPLRLALERGCAQSVAHASSEANSVTATIAEGLLSKAPLDGCVSARSTC
jgi:hypothetical protein